MYGTVILKQESIIFLFNFGPQYKLFREIWTLAQLVMQARLSMIKSGICYDLFYEQFTYVGIKRSSPVAITTQAR